jgi:hypothetical protein
MPTPYTFIAEHGDCRSITGTISGAPVSVIHGIVVSPGQNYRLVVSSFILNNESAQSSAVIELLSGNHAHWRTYLTAGESLSKDFPPNYPWKLGKNQALGIRSNNAGVASYSIRYRIEQA